MQHIYVGLMVFTAVTTVGGAIVGLLAARAAPVARRLYDPGPRSTEAHESRTAGVLARLGSLLLPGGASVTLGERLTRAGFYSQSAPAVYMGLKVLLLVVGGALTALLLAPMELSLPVRGLISMCVGVLLFMVPNVAVDMRRREHERQVRQGLPDVMDLLEICVSSGMGIDTAWNLISDELRDVAPALADEMVLTNLEMHLGVPRVEALRDMGERTGAQEVSSLASLLAQSERFGTSIGDTLRTFAATMREERSLKAQEEAEKTAVKLLFPMIVFIFPVFIAVAAGPAVLNLADVLMN